MNKYKRFLALGHSLKKISTKISSLQATKDNQLEYWRLLTQEIFGGNLIKDIARAQEIKKGDRMNKDKRFLVTDQRFFSKISTRISCL